MHRLTGSIRHYDWGSTTALATFRGVEGSGRPEAELWFDDSPRLPFLVKVLAVDRPLSLQVHPDSEAARLGFAAAGPVAAGPARLGFAVVGPAAVGPAQTGPAETDPLVTGSGPGLHFGFAVAVVVPVVVAAVPAAAPILLLLMQLLQSPPG